MCRKRESVVTLTGVVGPDPVKGESDKLPKPGLSSIFFVEKKKVTFLKWGESKKFRKVKVKFSKWGESQKFRKRKVTFSKWGARDAKEMRKQILETQLLLLSSEIRLV